MDVPEDPVPAGYLKEGGLFKTRLNELSTQAAWYFYLRYTRESYFLAKSGHSKNSCRTDISANFWSVRKIAARRQFERKLLVEAQEIVSRNEIAGSIAGERDTNMTLATDS